MVLDVISRPFLQNNPDSRTDENYRLITKKNRTLLLILIESLLAVLPGLIFSLLSGAIGQKVLDRIMPDQNRNICLLPLQIGLGFAILIPVLNLLLVLHLFSPTTICSIILLFSISMSRNLYLFLKRFFARFYHPILIQKNMKLAIAFPLMIVAFTLVMGLIGLASPSTGYDSTVYHLTLPKLYAAAQGFVPRPDIIQSRYSQNLAGIHTLSYQWGGEGAVEFLNMIACALLLWLLNELLKFLDNKNRWNTWSLIIMCSSLQFIFYLYDADVEGWLAFLTLCLYTFIWLITKESSPFLLLVLGVLGGCLIGIKPTSSPIVIIALLFGITRLQRLGGRIHWTVGLGAFLFIIVIGAFWYFIIMVVYGNLYGSGIIGENYPLVSLNRIKLHNIWISFKSVIIYSSPILIYIFSIPYSIKNKIGKDILIVFVCTSIGILITNPWGTAFVRYLFPIFPLTVLGIVFALKEIESIPTRRCKIFLSIAIIFLISSLLLTQGANVYRNSRKSLVAFRVQAKDEYLASRVNTYRTIKMANSVIPSNGMLFMVGERSYWLEIPYVLGVSRNPFITYDKMTPDDFFQLLESYKVTHLMFSDEPSDKTSDFTKFWSSYPELKSDRRLKLLYHDVWNHSTNIRNSYLYEVASLPSRTGSKGEV